MVAGKRKKNTAGPHCQRGARVVARRSSKPRQPFRKERKEEEEGERHARWIQQGGGGRGLGRGTRARYCERILFYLLPLSSPVLHSKKKDSEGGVIGRLLLFHEAKGRTLRGREKGERTESSPTA